VLMSRRRWTSLALLSIIIPMSLLATFRLIGVLQEPPRLETIIAEGVTWSMERPLDVTRVAEKVENVYADSFAWANFSVLIDHYICDSSTFDGRDTLLVGLSVNASASNGFIESVDLYLLEEGNSSIVEIWKDPDLITLVNLKFDSYSSTKTPIEAYLETSGVNQSGEVHMVYPAIWQFLDQNNLNHLLEIRLELTYRDGAVYNKVVVPISLEMYIEERV
jgi:hypothetical protein